MPCLKDLYGKKLKEIPFDMIKVGMKIESTSQRTYNYCNGTILEVNGNRLKVNWPSHNSTTNPYRSEIEETSGWDKIILVREFKAEIEARERNAERRDLS